MQDLAPEIYRQRMVVEGLVTRPIDAESIKGYLSQLSKAIDMVELIEPVTHQSPLYGWAGWIHWETSGAHFYAWDQPRLFFSVDVYACKPFSSQGGGRPHHRVVRRHHGGVQGVLMYVDARLHVNPTGRPAGRGHASARPRSSCAGTATPASQLADEYGPYEDRSVYLVVSDADRRRGGHHAADRTGRRGRPQGPQRPRWTAVERRRAGGPR